MTFREIRKKAAQKLREARRRRLLQRRDELERKRPRENAADLIAAEEGKSVWWVYKVWEGKA